MACWWSMCVRAVFVGLAASSAVAQVHEAKWLWEIGKADRDTAEFALGRDGWREYKARFGAGPVFVVGESDARQDWPYVHPGPSDVWAGSRRHTFAILFGLREPVGVGEARLVVDLLDTHDQVPPTLRIAVNGHSSEHQTPQGGPDASVDGDVTVGRPHRIEVTVPAGVLCAGGNLITIESLTGSWVLYDHIGFEAPPGTRLAPATSMTAMLGARAPALLQKGDDGRLFQKVVVSVAHGGSPTGAALGIVGGPTVDVTLKPGNQEVSIAVPAVEEAMEAEVVLKIGGETIAQTKLEIAPARKWTVYLLHHTHLDIGYTHLQTDVEALQWKHLEEALELARDTVDYPAEARFKWNPEGLWAIDSYLRHAPPHKRERFIEAVRAGSFGLDALYGNELTGLCRPEELFELVGYARRIAKQNALTIDSAMISDVPGYSWGLVPALARSGVKYLSIGPNSGHRIGDTRIAWSDRPFYWSSPSGEHKLLCWMAGKGYGWFHGPWRGAATFDYDGVESPFDPGRILQYLTELERDGYPYDMVQVRYNIGSDNGPPDPRLSDFVRDWNARYAYPKFVITTTSAMFHAFEERYGEQVPVVRGDFTPYWEDGAASSARETAINRENAERLVQAETLWALLDRKSYPAEDFHAAWRNVVLYDEHTWGSWNSISEPDGDFTLGQWKIKQAFGLDAERQSRALLNRALAAVAGDSDEVTAVRVLNANSWQRTDLVVLPKGWKLAGERVVDAAGRAVPSQRLSTGELAFVARDVPALGGATYAIRAGDVNALGQTSVSGNLLQSELLTVRVNEKTGAVASLRHAEVATDFVDGDNGMGLNDYFYVAGRNPDDPRRNGPVTIRVVESGPLVAELLIESDAPGCRKLTRRVRLVDGLDRVDITDVLDKEKIYAQEGVHLAYPFNVPDGVVRMDIAWGVVRPEVDQLPGACKNYFTVQRWVDVSNDDYGVTWATVDAPLVEVGAIRADPIAVGWTKRLEPSTTLYSYAMNNYWETNYKAGQEGAVTFRYALRPHRGFDAAAAQRFGIERSQPLIAVPSRANGPRSESRLRVVPASVLVSSLKPSEDGGALILRLFNACDHANEAELTWSDPAPVAIRMSSPGEAAGAAAAGPIRMPAWGIVTLRCELR